MKPYFPSRAVPAAAPRRAGAFSLVITLIIVSMLAVVAIGFLASMSSERTTADAFGNKTRAEQAAQAGVDSAMAILREAFKDFPDSATVWETQTYNKDGVSVVDADHPIAQYNEGTSLYLRAMGSGNPANPLPDPTADNSPSHVVGTNDGSDARQLFVLPLTSGAAYRPLSKIADWTDPKVIQGKRAIDGNVRGFADTYVDLNVRRYKNDNLGWIGSPPRPASAGSANLLPPKTVRVPWVNITQADATPAASAPTVARYAFWVEDESFRANINYAGLGDTSTGTTRTRLDNTGSPLAAAIVDPGIVDLFGPLKFLFGDSSAASLAKSLSDVRGYYPGHLYSESLGFAHTSGLAANQADQLRYITTTTSSGLNLSRHGTQRVNLNQLIYPKPDASGVAKAYSDQEQIDAIVHTIQFHAPNFGQRFYRNVADAKKPDAVLPSTLNALQVANTGDSNHQLIYLYKIATNIKDYMDQDPIPTLVDGVKDSVTNEYTGQVHTGIYPSNTVPPVMVYPISPGNTNVVWAQGKDSAPYLDECAVAYRGSIDANNMFELDLDYYVEVWNPTTQDVRASELGGNPRIHIANQNIWKAEADDYTNPKSIDPEVAGGITPSAIDLRRDFDFYIPISTVFKAGKATVLTTDKLYASRGIAIGEALNNFIFCPRQGSTTDPSTIVYKGKMPTGTSRLVWIGDRGQGPNYTSYYDTEVIFYSDKGYLDFAPGPLPIYTGNTSYKISISKTEQTKYKSYGGSLRANGGQSTSDPTNGFPSAEPSTLGDPRSNNEQLSSLVQNYYSGLTVNQPRYYNFSAGSNGTLGYPNVDFTQPENNTGLFTAWPDYYKFPSPTAPAMDASKALMFVANVPLTSIGQLGDIYDPARFAWKNVSLARGGGRTLKIGQHDDLWDGDDQSASHSWAAWRLADFFAVNDAMLQPGLININGVARDNGAALRAALTGFKFLNNAPSGQGAPTIEKLSLPVEAGNGTGATQGLDTLVSQMKRRIAPEASNYTTGTVGVAGDPTKPDLAPYNTGQGPFFERGELSELPAFGRTNIVSTFPPATYTGADLVSGAVTNTIFDRGREEIFRRLSEIVTTRGNVFTVYAMGQSLSPAKGVSSTQRLKVTFRLVPKKSDSGTGSPASPTKQDFHPGTKTDPSGNVYPQAFPAKPTSAETSRFAKPDHYDIEILSASKGGG